MVPFNTLKVNLGLDYSFNKSSCDISYADICCDQMMPFTFLTVAPYSLELALQTGSEFRSPTVLLTQKLAV